MLKVMGLWFKRLKDDWLLAIVFLFPLIFLYVTFFTKYWPLINSYKHYILFFYLFMGMYILPLHFIRHSKLNIKITYKNIDTAIEILENQFKIKEDIIYNLKSEGNFSRVEWDKQNKKYIINLIETDSNFSTLIHEFCHIKTGQAKVAEKMDRRKLYSRLYNLITDLFSCYWKEIYYLFYFKGKLIKGQQ